VLQETVSVRLEKIVAATAVIRIDAGVDTTDYQRFLAVAEDLNLRMIELVHDAGAVFSGPGQVLQLRDFQQASQEKMAEIEASAGTGKRRSNAFPRFHQRGESGAEGPHCNWPAGGSPEHRDRHRPAAGLAGPLRALLGHLLPYRRRLAAASLALIFTAGATLPWARACRCWWTRVRFGKPGSPLRGGALSY
jgi:hypothetical protein